MDFLELAQKRYSSRKYEEKKERARAGKRAEKERQVFNVTP